ncbi:major facilitator superfamily domain-containing protein 6-like [Acropora palmata]|uniref:major facilitator superfamily domain-containing protein 6-like n=1 Tax=Acropora palmata TaxID=6131 RepID=UPI003DA14439
MIPSSYEPIGSDFPIESDEVLDSNTDGNSQQSKWRRTFSGLRQLDKSFFVSKAFYFFFYTALGSLFPFFSVFYKQLWLTPGQIGLLLALRPAVKLVCLPLWKMVSDRYSKPKVVYFISIFGWIIGYFGQSFVYPSNLPCYSFSKEGFIVQTSNISASPPTQINSSATNFQKNISSRGLLEDSLLPHSLPKWDPKIYQDLNKREKENVRLIDNLKSTKTKAASQGLLSQLNGRDTTVIYANAKSERQRVESVESSPPNGNIKDKTDDGLSFEDSGDETKRDAMNNVGIMKRRLMADSASPRIIEKKNSDVIKPYEKVGDLSPSPRPLDDFRVKFNVWIFRCLTLIVILTEIITTPTPMLADSAIVQSLVETKSEYGKQRLFGSLGLGLASILVAVWVSVSTDCLHTDTINYLPCFYLFEIAIGATVWVSFFVKFDRPLGEENVAYDFLDGMRLFTNFRNGVFLVTLFSFGFFHSLHYSFLFWYLQDLGGTPVLFSIILLMYCLAEVATYFLSGHVVDAIGQQGMICLAFACYTARFLMYSYLKNAWFVIPMELVQGITYGGVWSIAAVYVNAPSEATSMVQSILHGSYWGIGMALGSGISGVVIDAVGARTLFLVAAGVTFLLSMFHLGIDIYNKMSFIEEQQQRRLVGSHGDEGTRKNKKKDKDFIGAAAAPLVPCLLYGR